MQASPGLPTGAGQRIQGQVAFAAQALQVMRDALADGIVVAGGAILGLSGGRQPFEGLEKTHRPYARRVSLDALLVCKVNPDSPARAAYIAHISLHAWRRLRWRVKSMTLADIDMGQSRVTVVTRLLHITACSLFLKY